MNELFKKMALLGDVWVLWLLVAASILSFGVIIERWRTFRKNNLNFGKFLEELSRKLENGDIAGARSLARTYNGVEARVVMAGLANFARGPVAVEEAMTSKLVMERSLMEKNLIILGTLGNNAPFVGLFGTVLGIIKAFNDLAVNGSGGASVVMAGVSSALIATAFGIFVAIPAVAANNFFFTRIRNVSANCQSLIHLMQVQLREERGMKVEAILSYMAASQQSEFDGVVTGINVTPLVDIMLVLLIIFMVTARFVSDTGVKINLPKAATSEVSATAALTVSLDQEGRIRLQNNEVDLNGLKANLARESQINPGVRVNLAADGALPYDQIVAVLDTIKQAGVTRVALQAEK